MTSILTFEPSDSSYGVSLEKKKKPAEGEALVRRSPFATEITILSNQDFYLPGYPKTALVKADNELPACEFSIVDTATDQTVLTGKLTGYGRYRRWGNEFFYFIDFTSLNREGNYQLIIKSGSLEVKTQVEIKSAALAKAIDDAARYFYYQRCGTAVPGWHNACHTNDPQETTGGWHDAGDYNKYIYTQWQPAWALLGLYEETHDRQALEEAVWGVDFLAKMVKPDGSMWSAVFGGWNWIRPELDGPRQLTAAQWGDPTWAMATCSATFARMAKNSSSAAREKYLELAERTNNYFTNHFNFQHIPRGEDLQGLGGIVLSDLLLYELTKKQPFLNEAEKNIRLILAHQHPNGFFFSDDNPQEPFWDDYMTFFFVEALGEYAKRYPTSNLTQEIKSSLERLMEKHVKLLAYNTPYQQLQWLDPFDHHPANGQVFENFYLKLIEGWVRGSNSYYLSTANAALIAYALLGKPEYKDIAINQLNWVLGVNPYGLSFMEGHCRRCTQHYHHRYDTLPGHQSGAVPGGITNGLASNNSEDYLYDLLGNTWASNETWLPHDAWFIMLGLKLNDYLNEPPVSPILPTGPADGRSRPANRPESIYTVIEAQGPQPDLSFLSVRRNGEIREGGDSIGVDVVFRFANLSPSIATLRSYIYTNQVYPQGEARVCPGQTDYTFKAFFYKLNQYNGFFFRGYDSGDNMIFQTGSSPVPLPE